MPQGHTLRLISSWQYGHASSLPSDRHVEHVAPRHFASVEDMTRALRACNHAVVLLEPGRSMGDDIHRLRALAQACRQAETQRLVVVSCGSMLSSSTAMGRAPGWSDGNTGLPPLRPLTRSLRARAALELELFRFAADAMDLVTLYPGIVSGAHDPVLRVCLDGQARQALEVPRATISLAGLVASTWESLWLAEAGERYALAECHVTGLEMLEALSGVTSRGALEAHARFEDPLASRTLRLDARRAREKLGLRFVPSFDELIQGRPLPSS